MGRALAEIPRIAPRYVQYGSADWFWRRWPNSFALQVMPRAQQFRDEAILDCPEARRTQEARDRFFDALRRLLAGELARPAES